MSNKTKIFTVLIVMLLLNLSCMSTTSNQISQAAKESTQTAGEAPASTKVSAEKAAKQPTKAPTETSVPKPPVEDLILQENPGFVQEKIQVLPVFSVENPNENYAFEGTQYEISALDASGTLLKSTSGYLDALMPGEKTSLVADMYLEDGQVVDKITVQLKPGNPVWMDQMVTIFTVENQTFFPDDNFPRVTGVLKNGLNRDLKNVQTSAVAYDEAGKVIGAGYTYVNFIPAGGQTGVSLSLQALNGTVSKVALFPMLSSLSSLEESKNETSPLTLEDSGFGQADEHIGIGYLLTNADGKNSVEDTQIRMVVYNAEGVVLGAEESSVSVIFPGEKIGQYDETFIPKGTQVARVDVQFLPGDLSPSSVTGSIFKTEQVTYLPDPYFPKASAVISNGLNKNIERFRVSTIAYNEDGKIIGGGYTYLDFLPPSGQSPVDMSIVTGEAPTKVEIYPTLSSLSDLENVDLTASPVQLVTQGYTQNLTMVGVGFIVKNTDPINVYGGSQYQIAAYDDAGKVLSTTSGYLSYIYPGTQIGDYADMSVPENTTVARVEVQINPGSPETPVLAQNPFTFDGINYLPDPYFAKVTATIQNAHDKKITSVRVATIAYDASGAIIGGGFTYVDFVPASGQAAVSMSVNVTGTPASFEMYGEVSSLSSIE